MKWFRENWYFVVIAVVVFGVLFTSQDSFSDKAANKVDAQSEAYLADFNEKKEEILRQIAEDTEKEREKLEEERTAEEQESEQNYESDAQDTCSAGELDDAETSSSASDEITVYITDTGERYHKEGCSSLRRSKQAVTLSEAIEEGYTPCQNCDPPTE